MTTISKMRIHDRTNAAALWRSIFGDSEAFTSWFFAERFCPEYSFAAYDEGRIVAMTLGRPTQILVEGKQQKALLISGVSTLPEYRGQGLMHCLVRTQVRCAQRDGFSCCYLHPVSETLYAKLGFQNGTDALLIRSDTDRVHSNLIVREESHLAAMQSIYDVLLPTHDGMQLRDEKEFALLLQDYACDGSHTLTAYQKNCPVGYLIYLDDATVAELLALTKEAYELLLDETARRVGKPLTAIVPTDCGVTGERVYSMQYLVFDDAFRLPLKNGFCRLAY